MGSALSGITNYVGQSDNASRRAKAVKSGQAGKAAGRGSRKIREAVPAKTKRGW